VIAELGEGVSGWKIGDRVCALLTGGGYAEQVVVSTSQLLPVPEGMDLAVAASLPEVACTVWSNVVMSAGLSRGDVLLVHGGGGGIGTHAIQVGKAQGATVVVTASAGKLDRCRELGADLAIDYRNQDFEAEAMRLSGGEGLDLIMDAQGPTSFRKDYRLLRPGGRLVMYGISENSNEGRRDLPATLKSLAAMPTATMPWWKSLMVMNENKGVFGLNLLKWWDQEGSVQRLVEPLMADLQEGRLEPVVAEPFSFEQAGEAHRFIAERLNVGKVVLFPS
jgi:NADPH2:quinone reductase